MAGKLQAKSISKSFPINLSIELSRALMMIILGALAMFMHAKVKLGLHIPGHHGVEFMALLVMGKSLTNRSFSGSLFSIGVLGFMLLQYAGIKDPIGSLVYLIPGLGIDVLQQIWKNRKSGAYLWIFTGVYGGLLYALIPLCRYLFSLLTGYKYFAFVKGFLWPFSTFFLFGALGTLLGFGIYTLLKKK